MTKEKEVKNDVQENTLDKTTTEKKLIIPKDKFLEAGTYFGHKKSLWNPKMKEFLYPQTKRGIHIINTHTTLQRLNFAYELLLKYVTKNPKTTFLFVGTKKQAKDTIKENALRTRSFYVSERWLGGTLTNSSTIFKNVKHMADLEKKAETNFEGFTKKEGLNFQKELDKLHKNLNGIKNMRGLPNFMIVADPNDDKIAVLEARKKGVKVIGILDSNTDPDLVDFGIPGNDDSAKSINLLITVLTDAIAVGRGGKAKYAFQPEDKIVLPSYEKTESTKRYFPKNKIDNLRKFKKPTETQEKEEK